MSYWCTFLATSLRFIPNKFPAILQLLYTGLNLLKYSCSLIIQSSGLQNSKISNLILSIPYLFTILCKYFEWCLFNFKCEICVFHLPKNPLLSFLKFVDAALPIYILSKKISKKLNKNY